MKQVLASQQADLATDGGPYGGAVAAMLTPCRAPGEPDVGGMRRMAGILTQHGCDGLFVLGSTGELPLLDETDRRALVAAAREGAGERPVIYAGVSGTGVKQSIRYARHAAADGANVAITMAPFFLKLSQPELHAYIAAIADASPIPLGIYHHLRMPSTFEIDTVARLAEHPNLVVMKDTSVDVERMQQLVRVTRGTKLALFQGSELILLPSLECGASGCVTALAGIAPEWHRDLIRAHVDNDRSRAQQWQQRIAALSELFRLRQVGCSFAHFAHTLRYAAQQRGWIASAVGMIPGFEADPAFEQAIHAHLQATQLISDDNVIGQNRT